MINYKIWRDMIFFFIITVESYCYLPITEHLINGSPVNEGGHEHIGLWLITSHTAATPQAPIQGSTHFWFWQASFKEHSRLTTHSGLQVGGLLRYPGRHEQTACPCDCWHWLFGPHGDGLHGLTLVTENINTILARHSNENTPCNKN